MTHAAQMTSKRPGGHYRVGEHVFYNKYDALLASTQSGIIPKVFPKWFFYNDIWEQQNWEQIGPIDLYSLYRSRARQLRETYQYICLSWSGGSDSTTALKSFVDSGIFIDEIMVRWPIKGTAHLQVHRDPTPSNILSEWQLTMLPLLQDYQRQAGDRTQISILDWTDEVADCWADESVVWQYAQGHLNPSMHVKHRQPSAATIKAIDRGLSTAIVYGIEKPRIKFNGQQVYCTFLDVLTHTHVYPPWDIYVEHFYWSPNFPTIVPAQASVIYQHLLKNLDLLDLIDNSKTKTQEMIDQWHQIVRNLIYPEYAKQKWFQANKPTSCVMDEIDHWMLHDACFRKYLDSWHNILHSKFDTLSDHCLIRRGKEITGFVPLQSGTYYLGAVRR